MVEQDITSSSRPYVKAMFGPIHDKNPLSVVSTVQSETGKYNGSEFVADGSAIVMSAEIEGIVPMGRKGNLVFKDVAGVWPSRMTDVGRAEAAMMITTSPNLKIEWGWSGLKKGRNEYSAGTSHYDTITAFITAVSFDVLDDGVVTVTVQFVQYSDAVTINILSGSLDDIIQSNPKELWETLTNVCGGEPTAIDVINYVLAVPGWKYPKIGSQDSPFSFGQQLADRKIIIQASTEESPWNAKPLKGDNDLLRIAFAMSLDVWLSEMISKVVLDEEGQKAIED